MSDDTDPDNPGFPVALVPKDIFDDLYHLSLWGSIDKDGVTLNGFDYIAQIAGGPGNGGIPLAIPQQIASAFLNYNNQDDRHCMIVIVNALDSALTLNGTPLMIHGEAAGHPDTQTQLAKGGYSHSNADVIPGHSNVGPGADYYGVGVYHFRKTFTIGIGFHGTEGAMAFKTDDPNGQTVGIAWCVDMSGNNLCAGTAMLSQYGGVQQLYDETVGAYKSNYGEGMGNIALNCTIAPARNASPAYAHYYVVVVVIQPPVTATSGT